MESSSSGGGLARRRSSGGWGSFSGDTDPFDIPAKGAPLERLRKWRQAALVLNASRRFRYTLDLKKEEQNEEIRRKIRAKAYVITAAFRFKEAGRVHVRSEETKVPIADGALGFGIKEDEITALTRDHNYSGLQQYGGVSGVAHMLKTDSEKGISGDDSDLIARKNTFGSNTYPRKKGRSFLAFVWDACKDLTLIILMVAAAVSLALGITTEGIKEGWYDGASIAFAVLLVVFVTAISDYKQSLQFQNLNEEKQNIRLEVVRGGRRITVSIYDLVVGDVVPLKIGDQVPADGILINGHSLSIDESSMTGESKIVHKDQKSPFLMSGCKVADGYGTMLVTAVGVNTEWGLLMASISEDSGEETPLQVRLNGVATFIGMVGLSVALAVLVVLLARYFTGHTYNPDGSVQYVKGKMGVGQTIRGVVRIFTVAVTIVVVAVPEGLPLAVTLTLAFSMRKMMKDKALVRRLSACETMGSATTICSDKTGTLTLNQMTVVEAYFGGKKMDSPDNAQMLSADVTSLIVEGIAQNTSGSIFEPEGGQEPEVTGSPTEKAILSWGLKLGMKFNETRLKSSILHVFPFNSEKKRGGVAVHLDGPEVHIHWKGAAEIILDSCTSWLDTDGSKHSMTPEKDPCRPGVRDSVRLCQAAGIKVRMVTGDNLQTARAIALECGILDDPNVLEPVIIEGKAFRVLSDLEREEAAEKISVMGRSSPNDKLLLVKALRARGHVVAVTGDGTNDAPALHEVVRWGRSVYANIQKFIQFQLTVNVAALIINVVAAVSSGNVPLNAVQLLWVNLIMDTLGALALATEPPTNHLMERPPVGRREPLITNIMWRNLIIMALFQVSVLLTLNFKGISLLQLKNDDPAHADKVKNTFIFNTFVLCQVFNEFNSRKPDELNIFKGISGNHLFIGIIAITVVLQALIVEFLGKFASTVRLSWQLWLVSIGLAFFGWPLAFVGKLIPVPKRPLGEFFACCCICKGSKQAPDDATSNDKEDNKPEP
ncbi:Calcium-transporting ATPase 9 plasma membrane-type [Zea mays]|uniref:P-type Ca(2+) transporter n=1 Tax=Zea mays TaxID=4577 RepID=A0A1D6E0B6_MAIZE|nr:Calcium-transporting ATPase 9 plasma membrane-type [Zea mays]ONM14196.1 Calcium-transporting ATPase 9 plasma membrane-type [Zea mays]ONM14199.1 Calcium-transporting ATPase 9 plasma membrane-type [Zea mays]